MEGPHRRAELASMAPDVEVLRRPHKTVGGAQAPEDHVPHLTLEPSYRHRCAGEDSQLLTDAAFDLPAHPFGPEVGIEPDSVSFPEEEICQDGHRDSVAEAGSDFGSRVLPGEIGAGGDNGSREVSPHVHADDRRDAQRLDAPWPKPGIDPDRTRSEARVVGDAVA